jgi:hypothetical protein
MRRHLLLLLLLLLLHLLPLLLLHLQLVVHRYPLLLLRWWRLHQLLDCLLQVTPQLPAPPHPHQHQHQHQHQRLLLPLLLSCLRHLRPTLLHHGQCLLLLQCWPLLLLRHQPGWRGRWGPLAEGSH